METEHIIYLVAFALILRIVIRLIYRYMKDQKQTENSNDKII
jgi:hypothetical protein